MTSKKVSAVLLTAAGKSIRATAEAAGVSTSTISKWRSDPVFAEEVERIRTVYEQKPQDGAALMARLAEVEQRFRQGAQVDRDGTVHVHVTVSAGASPKQREKAIARALARGASAALRERS